MKDIGIVSENKAFIDKIALICKNSSMSIREWKNLDALIDSMEDCTLIVGDASSFGSKDVAAEYCQAIRYNSPKTFIICVINKRMTEEDSIYIKKNGANIILLEEEFNNTGKIDFIIYQIIKNKFLPIKITDLIPNDVMDFDVYHYLSIKDKFLKISNAGDVLDPARYERLYKTNELYIERKNAIKLTEYRNKYLHDNADPIKICRDRFLDLSESYFNLVFHLTDQSEISSFKAGGILFDRCNGIGQKLIEALKKIKNPKDIVENLSMGAQESLCRIPAIATYAAIIGIKMGLKPETLNKLFLATLFSDMGLVMIKPSILDNKDAGKELTPEEIKEYQSHPLKSINIILDRKVPLDPDIRKIILSTHELPNGTGFPKGIKVCSIPLESEIIRFSTIFYDNILIKVGKAKSKNYLVKSQLVEKYIEGNEFDTVFMLKLRDIDLGDA